MLEKINSPADIKALHIDELERLADEIRSEIIKTTLHNAIPPPMAPSPTIAIT